MGRSFYRLEPKNVIEDFQRNNTFDHAASERHYQLIAREGKYYQRRYQSGLNGSQINVVEKRIDYVLGSGNHSRTYLSRTEQGRLLALPIAWYREGGGSWGMAPGYDRPDHMDFRRELTTECIFCHNAYPRIVSTQGDDAPRFLYPLPEGIDCQRCHGPGGAHIDAVTRNAPAAAIRAAIVNPARLSSDRQLEICLQCHLESTSRRLPYAIRRYDREPFSYRPGEPLANFILHFDLARPDGGDFFEVNHAAYRLLQSTCFRKSDGRLLCTTCHNPHEPSQRQDTRSYAQPCLGCHKGRLEALVAAKKHSDSLVCVKCHMPERRTEDARHLVMTDHRIARRPPKHDLQEPLQESPGSEDDTYLGEVRLLYPPGIPADSDGALYLAVAQVKEAANLKNGVLSLSALLRRRPDARAEFHYELGGAFRKTGDLPQALAAYEEARRRNPNFVPGVRNFADMLAAAGRIPGAIDLLKAAVDFAPGDAKSWNMLGGFYAQIQRPQEAAIALRRAMAEDPELPEIYTNLGVALSEQGERAEAENALRKAILLAPDLAVAHLNLGALLATEKRIDEARAELEIASHGRRPEARNAALRLLGALSQ